MRYGKEAKEHRYVKWLSGKVVNNFATPHSILGLWWIDIRANSHRLVDHLNNGNHNASIETETQGTDCENQLDSTSDLNLRLLSHCRC